MAVIIDLKEYRQSRSFQTLDEGSESDDTHF